MSLSHFVHRGFLEGRSSYYPDLYMRKPVAQRDSITCQGHRAGKWLSLDSDPGNWNPERFPFTQHSDSSLNKIPLKLNE